MQYLLGEPITLPVHVAVARPRNLHGTEFVIPHRIPASTPWLYRGAHFPEASYFLSHCADDELAVRYLEKEFCGKDGHRLLEQQCTGYLSGQARRLIGRAAIGTDSAAERRLVYLLREAGLKVTSNAKIGDYFWDIVLEKEGIAIEVDGYEYHHGSRENHRAFLHDRWKANNAATRGYLVLRYAAQCVQNVPDEIVEQVIGAAQKRRGWKADVTPQTQGNTGVWLWHPFYNSRGPRYSA